MYSLRSHKTLIILITITIATTNLIIIHKREKKNNLSAWDMSPIRAGVCSLAHLELMDNNWTVEKLIHFVFNKRWTKSLDVSWRCTIIWKNSIFCFKIETIMYIVNFDRRSYKQSLVIIARLQINFLFLTFSQNSFNNSWL